MSPPMPKPKASTAAVLAALTVSFYVAPLRGELPLAWRDDANLHAVYFVGKSIGWAVGDRGTAWRTGDGGRTWEARPVPTEMSLRAVYFLTDKVGWAAGGTAAPYTRVETGAVFKTEDAGATWRRINALPMPRLHAVRFFSLDDGIAAGAATADCPSGVLTTADGGATWKPIQTGTVLNQAGWRAAAFPEPGRGAVVGPRGRRSVIGVGQLIASREPTPGLRGLHAVSLVDPLTGWAAGDGGMVLKTADGGLVWQDPPALLPGDARDLFDFQAIAAVGEKVWVAGRPGSLVWHSPDGGRSWRPQVTGSTLPIEALRFTSETGGVAVGAMGQIRRTTDGGVTWQTVRGPDRRAALLGITSRPEQVSFSLAATLAGDQGYRSVSILPVRHDVGAADIERPNLDLTVHEAVAAAGGNAAVTDWPLPLSVPGLDRERDALVAEWNRRTEGRLQKVLVGRLVAAIRTWRPDVVVLDEPSAGDAAAELIYEAGKLAVDEAADPTRHFEHRQAALPPWRVKKLYVRLGNGETGDASIEADAVLSRLGVTAADLATFAGARVTGPNTSLAGKEEYRLVPPGDGPPLPGPFFAGLAIAPGSAARRAVAEPAENPAVALLATRQRNFRGYVSSLDDPREAAGVLAQVDELSAGLSPSQAARQLHLLAEAHRARSRWDLAEQTYLVLVERYPHEPPARAAMTWLLRLWTGAEPVWRRMQDKGATAERGRASIETLEARVETAYRLAEEGKTALAPEQIEAAGLGPDPWVSKTVPSTLRIDAARRWDDATVGHWRRQALRLGGVIRRVDPALFSTPEVQFPLASVLRNGGGSATAYLSRFAPDLAGGGWQPAAAAELALARPDGTVRTSTALCRRTPQPPHLDGVFADPCWRSAKEVRLASDPSAPLPEGTLVLLACDANFLYVAASLPRVPGRPAAAIELAGRTHDADLEPHDRLVLSLDVDRDYSTSFRFAVDQSGRTADDCWGDAAWDPNWFVAADGDDERWRIEAAIPFAELGPRPPTAGEMWAISLGRVAPAVGVQGWPRPNGGEPRPESFGLMRFE